ncbi:MAG: GIY-YIG nuclease family protein [Bacteroidota bacterium]
MFITYILYSKSIDKYYIGYTNNLELRIKRHNNGWSKYSSKGIPWELVYSETFSSKSDAIKRENKIKKMKSRMYIENLIKGSGGRPD